MKIANRIIRSSSLKDTQKIAQSFASYCEKGSVIALYGEIGAGKTYFSKALINAILQKDISVTSPTFNLVKIYDNNFGADISHFDLYRLDDKDDVWDIGFEDAIENSFSIIEWPEIIEEYLPESTVFIKITKVSDNNKKLNERVFEVVGV